MTSSQRRKRTKDIIGIIIITILGLPMLAVMVYATALQHAV